MGSPDDAVTAVGAAIKRASEAEAARPNRVAVAADQLEELFTSESIDADESAAFTALLAALARSGLVWVIATIRTDFLHYCAGVPGLSENITVRSIVGRYLEHARIYYFANGEGRGEPLYLIGSADLMPRNLDRRIEALIEVEDTELQHELWTVLEVNLDDDSLAWELDGKGRWTRLTGSASNTHDRLEELALAAVADA